MAHLSAPFAPGCTFCADGFHAGLRLVAFCCLRRFMPPVRHAPPLKRGLGWAPKGARYIVDKCNPLACAFESFVHVLALQLTGLSKYG